jgi:ADP-L-glycero-D-manno-heptose 6-epimerase
LFRDGEQLRDWLYITDAAQSVIKAVESNIPGFEIYNIGSGRARSFNDVVRVIWEKYQSPLPHTTIDKSIQYVDCPFPEQYQSHTECAIKKAGEKLGFSPAYDLESGIEEYLTSSFVEPS